MSCDQQRMIICRMIICLSALDIFFSFDSGCFKVPVNIRYSLMEACRNLAIDFSKLIVFQDSKAIGLLLMQLLMLSKCCNYAFYIVLND